MGRVYNDRERGMGIGTPCARTAQTRRSMIDPHGDIIAAIVGAIYCAYLWLYEYK